MNTKELSVTAPGKSSLERPRYYPGLLLEDEDLTSAVDYTRNSLRLLMRSLFGCGVVCGLGVEAAFACEKRHVKVTVFKGVALDCEGNTIEVTEDTTLTLETKCEKLPERLYVTVAYKERCCQQTTISCTEDEDGKSVPRRAVDGYEITVSDRAPKCACSCVVLPEEEKAGDEHKCCRKKAEKPAGTPAEKSSVRDAKGDDVLGCKCYLDHRNLTCGCGCTGDCGCVGLLIAVIAVNVALDKPRVFGAEDGVPRVVRPMLLGAACCYVEACIKGRSKYPSGATRDEPNALAIDVVREAEIAMAIARQRKQSVESENEQLEIIGHEVKARLVRAQAREQAAVTADDKAAAATELAAALRESAKFEAELIEFAKKRAEADNDLVVKDKLLDLRKREQTLTQEQAQLSFINERIALAESQKLDIAPLKLQRATIAGRVKEAAEKLNT